jgi:signal transduction histidine kinase
VVFRGLQSGSDGPCEADRARCSSRTFPIFGEPSAWERYRPQILAMSAALLAQAGLISWLATSTGAVIGGGRAAQRHARADLHECRAAVGELSSSIAHEVNQPLSAITLEAGAALAWLRQRRRISPKSGPRWNGS